MKVWITKYALTSGILEIEATKSIVSDEMVRYRSNGSKCEQYAHGSDWHKTKEAAIEKAEQMRIEKILSMRRQISKLEKLEF